MTDRGSTPDADAGLPLRHRLFPRAMAWNVQRQSGSPTAEQLVLAAAQVLEQQQRSHVDTMDVARSFPLLQASVADESFRPVPVTQDAPPRLARTEGDERERLFRAMGKYLDGTTATGPCSAAQTSPVYAQQTPLYYQAPPPLISRPYGGMPSPDRMTAEQQGAFQAMKISSYAEEEQRSWASQSQVLNAGLRTPPAVSPTPPGVHQIKLRSPPSATSGQKRTRGSTPAASSTSTAVGKDEIAPSLARALLTGCGAKQCSFEGCKKIAVSKGRCRGHGGGRRCQYSGCTKCAQSRSPFCWAHGGGKRCEAPNCRRSRKTKRFCVDHVDMELTVPLKPAADKASKPVSKAKSAAKSSSSRAKTSSSSYTSADSDDSVDRQSTVSCDSSFSVAHNKENKRMASVECVREHKYVQHQYAGEVSGISTPSLQLPSLNEALLRTVPTQYSSEAIWSTRTPSPPAPPSHYKSGYRPWPANSA
ncbi:hypothetical protein PC129_g12763 [Phytophthora cactorum]|uniref:WRKY19-like zinc finger domain-containing protein n=2 Tax=Phytophthora cactorum TaxID=29920 RepID=A0A8T1BS62_9STRA|nr:hypothetical protein GQ600_22733 [Phytophthora cactorum]KAG2773231.1 hypothetical protein Pcac1_g15931 [Phytophthora cactorum]KAG2812629.1 hypothetical protein PC111_g14737 [Phytophthora cactorum]KAG2814033.1 hypothetical protein PC112_g14482 [Phytophthora cactorum]KAG2851722.1 hypothetical protein PC113_g15663 [Phytophthora cactorum]